MTGNTRHPLAGDDRSTEQPDTGRDGTGGRTRSRPKPSAENTDLERRMLAHERILQSLIAHVAETDPKFISRLYATFGDPTHTPRQEHDYTDTDTYAARLIGGAARLGVGSPGADVAAPKGPKSHGRQSNSTPVVAVSPAPPTAFRVTGRTGVWRVTKDGLFYGDFLARTQADKAIASAIQAISRGGGSTVVL